MPDGGAEGSLAHLSVLVVDDEPGVRGFLARTLAPLVRRVVEVGDAEAASQALDRAQLDVILLDNVLPGRSGLDWLAAERRLGLSARTILITAFGDADTLVRALRLGVADCMRKPFRAPDLVAALRRCARPAAAPAAPAAPAERMLGGAPAIEALRRDLARAAAVAAPVLLVGETGTGKALAARRVHALSPRGGGPFVALACAGGAGDGLARASEAAAGGTLLLRGVGDLAPEGQAALLRALEGHEARLVATAGADLGRLRPDLLHRLDGLRLEVPPLRERVADLPLLAEHFAALAAREAGVAPPPLGEGVLRALAARPWPGNLRELRNLCARAAVLGRWPPPLGSDPGEPPRESLAAVERRHVLAVLAAAGGNRAEAARRLGVSRKTVDRKLALWRDG